MRKMKFKEGGVELRLRLLVIAVVLAFSLGASGRVFGAGVEQKTFSTPREAVDSLIAAERSGDKDALLQIFGPEGAKLVFSGDKVADDEDRRKFVSAYDDANRVETDGDERAVLVVGKDEWPFPIPVVKHGDAWSLDTDAGLEKILQLRIGRNELGAIEVCRAYVDAQREYASKGLASNGLTEYAQKFKSSPGKHDGLYWDAGEGEEKSPFGPLIESARAEGYGAEQREPGRNPYHGYYYKILTRQGENAPGGAKDYVVKDRMTEGFALLAFPAKWGDSGVMTFLVAEHGIVFQKNLGPDTAEVAGNITEFDPDLSWMTP
ncbi:MAG: DUF2950 domain-containing protein [Nitrospinae bacterium]|nr:DUF2950 domain-containing protein [Nitrospinota bacterium]